MPELPEVEVLVRHLAPRLEGRTIRRLTIKRARILRPTSEPRFRRVLSGAKFQGLSRRGKYLLFTLAGRRPSGQFLLVGHLGMTGRMYLQPASAPLPTHAAVVLELGKLNFVFEDPRYFGRLTLDTTAIDRLGPEPSDRRFSLPYLTQVLRRSAQAVKVRLLDQSIIAGVGNIYAGEALFRARIDPKLAANKLTREQLVRLRRALRQTLAKAIKLGGTIPLDWAGRARRNTLFYYGRAGSVSDGPVERFEVYDREGKPCSRCGVGIERIAQAGRSTYFCPGCQSV